MFSLKDFKGLSDLTINIKIELDFGWRQLGFWNVQCTSHCFAYNRMSTSNYVIRKELENFTQHYNIVYKYCVHK